MLSAWEKSVLKQFKASLKKTLGDQLDELMLFGSKARGDDRPDSDLDVLVIVTTDDWHICDVVYDIVTDIFLQTDISISPKVISKKFLEQLQKEDTFFFRNIRGMLLLYELFRTGKKRTRPCQ
jgi:predicted nucleotidyltransferase